MEKLVSDLEAKKLKDSLRDAPDFNKLKKYYSSWKLFRKKYDIAIKYI